MPVKEIKRGTEVLKAILAGVDELADTVKTTLGPAGQVVILERQFGGPLITKDGVSVAREIEVADPFENLGAQVVKEVAQRTNDVAGDGTTTATVLAQAIMQEGAKLVIGGYNPTKLQRGLYQGLAGVNQALEKLARPVKNGEEIAQVGTISANSDRSIGELIAEAMDAVGNDGVITIAESGTTDTALTVVEGMEFDKGYVSPVFINDERKARAVYSDIDVFCTDQRIDNVNDVVPILNEVVVNGGKPLLIVCDDMSFVSVQTIALNQKQGKLKVVAVRAPGYGERRKEYIKDICAVTGATFVSPDNGIKLADTKMQHLGRAKEIIVEKDKTTIIGGAGKKADVEGRIERIRYEIENSQSEFDIEKLKERLAKLVGGVAVISLGAATDAEMNEKKARVEDALHATRAAVEEGIVPGGGVALARCVKIVRELTDPDRDVDAGIRLLERVLTSPLRQIAENAGQSGDVIADKVVGGKAAFGYNAATNEYGDLLKSGVIDPKKVVRCALENAVSVSSLLFMTKALVVNRREAATDPLLQHMAAGGLPPL